MFRAIGRYIRALGYLVTGRVDAARRELSKNPAVIQATYDRIVEEKVKSINQYKNAVGKLVAQEEKKVATVKRLTGEVTRLERLKEGAAAKARSVVEKLKAGGAAMEAIKKNEDYMKCLGAFNDFSSSVVEKNQHIEELEGDIVTLQSSVADHKVQLQALLRDVEKIREESAATVADVLTAREEEEIADMISGISLTTHAKELQEMRDLRAETKAQARVARELAGTDTKRQEAEFLQFAREELANDEFDALIGLASEAETAAPEAEASVKTQLPEG